MTNRELGLGRLHAPDPNDRKYLMRALLPEEPSIRPRRYWNANGWWGDQGYTSQCVGYSWAHWVEDGPITHKGAAPLVAPADIYREAQLVDEWPGEGYDGTSVRAGAKALQARGLISAYTWAFDAATVVEAILEKGPVVVGTNWYERMFDPDPNTSILTVDGPLAGGHAYLLDGVNKETGLFRIKNSWGRTWGRNGFAYISINAMDRLIREDGEAALAVEVGSGKVPVDFMTPNSLR